VCRDCILLHCIVVSVCSRTHVELPSNHNCIINRAIIARDFRRCVVGFSNTSEKIFCSLAKFCRQTKIGKFFYDTRFFFARHCRPIISANFYRSSVMPLSFVTTCISQIAEHKKSGCSLYTGSYTYITELKFSRRFINLVPRPQCETWITVTYNGRQYIWICMYIFQRGKPTTVNEESDQRRRKHCALAVVRWSQKFRPAADLLPGSAGRPKFNQLEMVITFTRRPSLVRIDARTFELSW